MRIVVETHQIKYRSVYSESADAGGHEQNPDGFAPERGEIQKRRSIVVAVFVFDLSLLVLEMQNRTSLWMVQRRRPVARSQQERRKYGSGDKLQPESPPDSAMMS